MPAIRANCYPPLLSLSLLVTRILTDDAHDPMTPNNLTLPANTLNRSPHFHKPLSLRPIQAVIGANRYDRGYLAR
jgi:hypothetical protein